MLKNRGIAVSMLYSGSTTGDRESEHHAESRPVSVLTVDDHPIFRQGIQRMLEAEPGVESAGEAGSVKEALRWLSMHRADVVLLDHNLPEMNGVDGLRLLLDAQQDLQIVVLTVSDDDDVLIRAIQAGACAYILKDAPPDRLVDAIKAAAAGECRISEKLISTLFGRLNHTDSDLSREDEPLQSPCSGVLDSVTARERQILKLLVKGLSNKEIGRELNLSPNTVRNQLQRLQERSGTHNRVQLAIMMRECIGDWRRQPHPP